LQFTAGGGNFGGNFNFILQLNDMQWSFRRRDSIPISGTICLKARAGQRGFFLPQFSLFNENERPFVGHFVPLVR
jgi:hypothetical protein